MVSFVREKKWMKGGLSVVRRGPDNASEVSRKWRDHKMSGFGPPEVGTSHGIASRAKLPEELFDTQ